MDNLLECPICYDIAVDAVETICCNRIFCEKCIVQYIQSNGVEIECPLCRISAFKTKKSVLGRRMINEMTINCPNKCDSKIIRTQLQNHLEICSNRKIDDIHNNDNNYNNVQNQMNNNNNTEIQQQYTLNPDAVEFKPQQHTLQQQHQFQQQQQQYDQIQAQQQTQQLLYDQQLCQYNFNPATGQYVLNPYAQQIQAQQLQLLQQQHAANPYLQQIAMHQVIQQQTALQHGQTTEDTQQPDPTQNIAQQQQLAAMEQAAQANNLNIGVPLFTPTNMLQQIESNESSLEFFDVDKINQIECKQVDDAYFFSDCYSDFDRCLKYNKNKRIIQYNSSPSISIIGSVDIFNGNNNNNNKHFGHWWRFKILQCNKIFIGIISSSNGTLNGGYFNNEYSKNDLVDMFAYLSSDSLYILLYFSINGSRKRLKKIKYEQGNIYNMIVNIGGCIKLLNYSSSYNDIKNNKNCNDNKNSSKDIESKYVPSNYKCFKCGTIGKHWITDC